MKPVKILGEGGFGMVTDEGDRARKHLRELHHTIREVVMMKYMRSSEYIIDIESYNLQSRTICSTKWSCSLRDCIINYDLTEKQKMKVLHDILTGLCHFHQVDIVHADMTLQNFFVNTKKFSACIGDLGLSSITDYARVYGTAKGYSPMTPVKCHGHDMFGLAVSMTCLFSHFKICDRMSPKQLRDTIRESTMNTKLKNIFIQMCPDNPRDAITAAKCLHELFGETTHFEVPKVDLYKCIIEDQICTHIESEARKISEAYDVKRGKRFYRCFIQFLSSPESRSDLSVDGEEIDIKFYDLYIVSGMYLYACLFGRSKLTMDESMKLLEERYSEDDFYYAVAKLIQSENFINLSLATKC